jgi:hypothetical protein
MAGWPMDATLTIPNGQTVSNVIKLSDAAGTRVSWNAMLYAPQTLPEATTVEVTPDGTTWFALRSGGVDVALTAGKADTLIGLTTHGLRVKAAAVAADRVFRLQAVGVAYV